MNRLKQTILGTLVGAVSVFTALALAAQPVAQSCGEAVRAALQAAGEACESTARNEVCYGNLAGSITPRNLSRDLEWEAVGDRVDLSDVSAIDLSPLDVQTNQWGVAVMQVQANLPDTLPGQNVTMIVFGDVEVGEAASADQPDASPMQAFYMTTGLGATECAEAPTDGVLIQTPKGVGLVNFTVNGMSMSFGSTAYLTSSPDEDNATRLNVTLLEGRGVVGTGDNRVILVPGSRSNRVLDEEGVPLTEWSELEIFEREKFIGLTEALETLDFDFDLPEFDDEAFEDYLNERLDALEDLGELDDLNDVSDSSDDGEGGNDDGADDVNDDDNDDNGGGSNNGGGGSDDDGGSNDGGGGSDDDGGSNNGGGGSNDDGGSNGGGGSNDDGGGSDDGGSDDGDNDDGEDD